MKKELITSKQGIITLIMFIFGSTILLGAATQAYQDIWIALPLAIAAAFAVVLMYGRLMVTHPGMDLYEILEFEFGKVLGKIISICYILFFIHAGTLTLFNFSGFIHIVGLRETPEIVSAIIMGLLCIWIVKEGVEVMSRWSQFMFSLIMLIVIFLVILSITKINFSNFKPVLYNGIYPVYIGALNSFILPFTQTIAFFMILNHLKDSKKTIKVFSTGLLIGAAIVAVISIRNLLVLGAQYESRVLFPTFEALSLINVGNILQRFEAFISVMFLFTGFVKISVFLLAACKGVKKLFNFDDYRKFAVPVGLLMILSSRFMFENYTDFVSWLESVFSYYALPFQVFLPVILLITSEIKLRFFKKERTMENLPQSS